MGGLNTSITGLRSTKGILSIEAVNIRDYAFNKHNSVDDYPCGWWCRDADAGRTCLSMLSTIIETRSIHKAVQIGGLCVEKKEAQRCCTCHHKVGTFTHGDGRKEACAGRGTDLLCGHLKGLTSVYWMKSLRIMYQLVIIVLTGGELPAMVMVDAVSGWCRVVLGNDVSAGIKRVFQDNLLGIPAVFRPEIWHEKQVPPVLLSDIVRILRNGAEEAVSDSYCKESSGSSGKKPTLTEEEKKKLAKSVMV